jgi:hypothetical protein
MKSVYMQSRVSETDFLNAAYNGRLDVVRAYIAENVSSSSALNVTDSEGMSALFAMASRGHIDLTELLLQQSNFDLSNHEVTVSMISLARENGHHQVAVMILNERERRGRVAEATAFEARSKSSRLSESGWFSRSRFFVYEGEEDEECTNHLRTSGEYR